MWIAKSFLYVLVTAASDDGSREEYVSPVFTGASIVVAIDPEKLLAVGLAQSWPCIHDKLGNQWVHSRPLSKVHFKLKPLVSTDSALMEVDLQGVSVGETTMQVKSVEVVTDSLTRFHATQILELGAEGVAFSRPMLTVETNQSFNRSHSDSNPLAGVFARTAIKRFPQDVQIRTRQFARRQIEHQIEASNGAFAHRVAAWQAASVAQFPVFANLAWHVSSDERNIHIVSYSHPGPLSQTRNEHPQQPQSQPNRRMQAPVLVFLRQSLVEDWLLTRLADKQFGRDEIEAFYRRSARRIEMPPLAQSDEQAWSLQFDNIPSRITFDNNAIQIELRLSRFSNNNQDLPPTRVRLDYQIHSDAQGWNLANTDFQIHGEGSGARQQVVRSVMRSRLERLLPQTIAIPETRLKRACAPLAVELKINEIVADSGFLILALDSL